MVVLHSSDPFHAAEEIDGLQENQTIAQAFLEIADLLAEQNASEFRVRAYRAGAETIANLPSPIRKVLENDGVAGLEVLPTIGHSLASLIESALRIGRIPLLDRLRGQSNAEHFFATLPGIGQHLSHQIYEHLHLETLPELQAAANDGRLERVPGIGRKRVEAIRAFLAFSVSAEQKIQTGKTKSGQSISVDELLDVDREYRERAVDGSLAKIRHTSSTNSHEVWLPILHTERQGRHYTAMFSNTSNAIEQNATHDWVVVFRDDENAHGRWTIITSQFGKLKGFRIVRGREDECQDHYRLHNAYHHREAGHPPFPELPAPWEEDEGRRGIHG